MYREHPALKNETIMFKVLFSINGNIHMLSTYKLMQKKNDRNLKLKAFHDFVYALKTITH